MSFNSKPLMKHFYSNFRKRMSDFCAFHRYNFTPRVTHMTFDAEEAEEKFAERAKILNHWAVKVGKKLNPGKEDDDDEDLDDDGKKKKKGPKGKGDLKVSGERIHLTKVD